jgi:hypothetical protein
MPITYEAKSAADRRAGKSIVLGLAKEVGSDHVSVTFSKDDVTITTDQGDTRLTRTEFSAWQDARFPWDGAPVLSAPEAQEAPPEEPQAEPAFRPQPKPASKRKAAAKPKPEPKPKATKPRRPTVDDPDDLVETLAAQALDIAAEEASGEHGRNVARFKRGELMIRLTGISQASKVPVKKLLGMLNQRTLTMASENQMPAFKAITEQEASTTRKVAQAFGSSGEFPLLNAIDPTTGHPLLNDAGEPYMLPLTEVAMNKLYPLVEYTSEASVDELLSFAHQNTEKVVKAAKRVAKSLEKPIMAVIADVNKMRVEIDSPLGLGKVMVPPSEADIVRELREMMGEAPEPDIASLKTSRAWYDGTWVPLKALVNAIAKAFVPEVVNESSGEVTNVFILERLITQLFHPSEDKGVQRVLAALVEAGDLTEGQANQFVDSFAFDGENDEWVRVKSSVAPEKDADELDDDLVDDLPDIDDPDFAGEDGPDELDEDFDDDL